MTEVTPSDSTPGTEGAQHFQPWTEFSRLFKQAWSGDNCPRLEDVCPGFRGADGLQSERRLPLIFRIPGGQGGKVLPPSPWPRSQAGLTSTPHAGSGRSLQFRGPGKRGFQLCGQTGCFLPQVRPSISYNPQVGGG